MTHSVDAPLPLRELQERMAARILERTGAGAMTAPGTPIDGWLFAAPPAQVTDRLAVYREGYPARIAESLAETYPAIAHLIGDREFAALAERYTAAVPLASYNLNDAGAALAAFLRGDAIADVHPHLADLAEVEWRVAAAFHAFDSDPLDPRTLKWTLDDWAGAVLVFQPSVSLVGSVWPLLDLWSARDRTDAFADVEAGAERHVLIRRDGFAVRCESVSANEANALQRLLDGCRIADVVEAVSAAGADAGGVSEWFSRWTACGMLAGATLHEGRSALHRSATVAPERDLPGRGC